jgi:hypothetical protein
MSSAKVKHYLLCFSAATAMILSVAGCVGGSSGSGRGSVGGYSSDPSSNDFSTWVTTVDNICQKELADWGQQGGSWVHPRTVGMGYRMRE